MIKLKKNNFNYTKRLKKIAIKKIKIKINFIFD
jgi:hypothetical protein